MKRDYRNISKENAAFEVDQVLREALKQESDTKARARRLEPAKEAELAQLHSYLRKWKNEKISNGESISVEAPVPVPNGTQFVLISPPNNA